jgi:hypothetical protein
MTRIRLEYVHEYQDRHGKLRRYFRRPGFKRIALPGAPGSDEFMTAYQLALAGQPVRIEIGAGRTETGYGQRGDRRLLQLCCVPITGRRYAEAPALRS